MNRGGAIRAGIAGFESGLRLFFEGGRFLRREPSLWTLAIVPVFFALVAVGIAGSLFFANLAAIAAWCNSFLPVFEVTSAWSWLWVGPATFAAWIAGGLAVVAAFAVTIVAALLLANLASAPFLERLSFRVEMIVGGEGFEATKVDEDGLSSALRSFVAELQRMGFLASVWTLLSLVGLIVPGAQLVTAPLLVAVTILFLPLDYAGHALDRRGMPFRDRLRFVSSNLPAMTGFGSVAFLVCFLPGFNLVVMPVLVTAGTLFVMRRDPLSEGERVSDLSSFSETNA